MVKAKSVKKQPQDDLLLTLDSDSETELVIENLSESEASEQEEKPKGKKKGKKAAKKTTKEDEVAEEEAEDINPDFQFSLDGYDNTNRFTGWDFKVEGKEDGPATNSKDIDLDSILRRKGGLVNLAGVEKKKEEEEENESEEDEEKEEEEEEEEEKGDDAKESGDEDELAMDGFGMGAEEENDSEDEGSDVEADMDEEHPGSDEEEEMTMESTGKKQVEEEEDSAEKIAEFYETPEETPSEKTQLHNTFQSLQLSRPILKGLSQLGYTKPSPIQSASIPIALMGKDIVAGAVTGSGKTAAYMIPIIERLIYKPSKISSTRVIVLTPTRELSIQVCDVGKKIGRFVSNLNFGLAVGGLNLRQQEQQLKLRPDIVIATPGRLIDHIRNSPSFNIESLEILVIDEADRMLEEGFQVELNEILSLIPKHKRQTLLFSATMNTKIQDLIQLSLQKPVRIMIDPPKSTSSNLIQEFVRIRKRDHLKSALLFQLLKDINPNQQNRIVVFVARKETAHKLRIVLGLLGMKVSELHGSLSQEQRLQSVNDFKNLTVPVLICTDLASRGLDIPKIEIVINYDMPKSHEIYLHRVGRTARAGRDGRSISFVGESTQDRTIVKDSLKVLSEEREKSASKPKSKAISRNVDWKEVEELHKIIDSKNEMIGEVLEEEKQAKEILLAEMEINKASNIMNHQKEIQSRPKRTWFKAGTEDKKHQTEVMRTLSKGGKQVNSKKRKAIEVKKDGAGRSYKKTKTDRAMDQKRNPKAKIGKKSKK